jgi:hypothetical protein
MMRLRVGILSVEGISVTNRRWRGGVLVFGEDAFAGRNVRAMTIEADDPGARIPRQRAMADEAHLKRSVERELRLRFPSVAIDHVTILVECLWSHFEGAPVRDFVPLLVQKQAVEELLDYLGPRDEAVVLSPGSSRK